MGVALTVGVGGGLAQGALLPVNLRCADRVNPLGIGDAAPRLSWQLQGDAAARGEVQSAYQIQVGSTPGAADLWDSGKVLSRQTVDVAYAGLPLTSGQACYWRVRTYDGGDQVSAWSAPAQWSMGLLQRTDWSAQWIGYDAAYDLTPAQATNNALFNTAGLGWIRCPGQAAQGGIHQSALRRPVVMPAGQSITNAVLALYADNECRAFVNGVAATNEALRWEATARINVTSLLHTGTNLLALSTTNSDAQQPASVIGRLVVQFASGSVTNLPVDTSWKAAQWPAGSWTQPGYDDASWVTPESTGTPWGLPALNDLARVPAPYLRKEFAVGPAVRRATVYVTALGAYELHLNGQKVGNDVLTPGWTQFSKRVYYQTYDVTTRVGAGTNVIGAILGDGWYAGDVGYKGSRLNYGGLPRLLVQLVIELADGTTQTVVSDGSWKAGYGPIQFADLLIGSDYDARRELPGWDAAAFDDHDWAPVLTGLKATTGGYADVTTNVAGLVANNQLNFVAGNDALGGDPAYGIVKTLEIDFSLGGTNRTAFFGENETVNLGGGGLPLTIGRAFYGNPAAFPGLGGMRLQAAVTEPARVMETLPAIQLTEPKPGRYTFDLGQNMVGWVRLNISGQIGDRITVRHGEMLNPDGTVYTANLRGANATDCYTFGTNGTVVYEPRFTFHGFRYVEVRGLSVPPQLNTVTGVVVHSDLPRTGHFQCSDPLVNQLFSNIIWGQKGNYLEVPTDCPQRDERLGWSGDTEFFVPTAAYNFDVQSFFRRHMTTFCEDSQHADGSFANVAPDVGAGSGAAAWGDAAWICPYVMYQDYGDTNIIADHYAAWQKYGAFLAAHATNHVIASLPGYFGDWVNLGGGASSRVIDTAFYAYYAQAMSEMAAVLGRNADAASYATLHSNIAAAFADFFKSDGSFTDDSSQTGYALAFTLGLVPGNLRSAAAQRFADSIAQFDGHLATGFIGTPRLLPALHAAGRDDLAYQLLLQKTYPSWLYQVTLGATTMWERWDGWTPGGGFQTVGMNSFNHYAFGAVGEYLYGVVGGIKPARPGYESIRIQPVPGVGLTWADTRYDSIRGPIATTWTNRDDRFDLAVSIPPNTTAEVWVPTTNAAAITESGGPAASAPGVTFTGVSNNCAVFQVGSGHYLWSSPLPTAQPTGPEILIATTNQTGSGSGTFYPNWGWVTNGSLIAGQAPATAQGNFSEEANGRSVNALTAGGSLALTQITGNPGYPITTSTNYVTCGNGNGAGSVIIYALTNAPAGYDVTNITVYGGWADAGRDQQAYGVYCSTVAAPATFTKLTSVNFNPPNPANVQSATRVSISSAAGVLATNVAAVKFDFTSPASENGFCGYGAIAIFGKPSVIPRPAMSASVPGELNRFVMDVTGLFPGWSYTLQSTTNLIAPAWLAETNFIATQPAVSFTFSTLNPAQKFFRVVGN